MNQNKNTVANDCDAQEEKQENTNWVSYKESDIAQVLQMLKNMSDSKVCDMDKMRCLIGAYDILRTQIVK